MDIATPAGTPAPAAAPDNAATPDPVVTATPDAGTQPAPKTFTQDELDKIVERRLAKERNKRKEVETRLKVTEELTLRQQPQQPAKPAETGEPKRDQFDSYEAFIEARAEWRADKKVSERFEKQQKEQQDRTASEQQQSQVKDFNERVTKLAKEIPDFKSVIDEAMGDGTSALANLDGPAFNECENPAAVLYHLAKNESEAERIAALPAAKQAREIWALDTKLKSAPATKKPSNAPEPISPVGGSAVVGDAEPDANDTGAWIAWRNKQLLKKRTG